MKLKLIWNSRDVEKPAQFFLAKQLEYAPPTIVYIVYERLSYKRSLNCLLTKLNPIETTSETLFYWQ